MLSNIIITIFIINLFGKSHSSRVEISLQENSKLSSKLHLICSPPVGKPSEKSLGNILWRGFKFGPAEQKGAALKSPSQIVIPKMKLNSNRLKCLLEALKSSAKGSADADKGFRQQRNLPDVATIVPISKLSTENRIRKHRELSGIPQTEKDNCPPGHRINKDMCFPCFPGSYTSGQETECFLCPKDYFVDQEGADSCWPCPGGRKTLKEGADSRDDCVDPTSGAKSARQKFSGIWIFLIILLIIFLLFSWILIIYLLVRLCFYKNIQTDKESLISGDITALKIAKENYFDQCEKSKPLEGRIRCKRHGRLSPIKRHLHFDVDIQGSATLTDMSSSSRCNEVVCHHGENIKETNTSNISRLNECEFSDDVNDEISDFAKDLGTIGINNQNTGENSLVHREGSNVQLVRGLESLQLNDSGESSHSVIQLTSISLKHNPSKGEIRIKNVAKSSIQSARHSELSVDREVKISPYSANETEQEAWQSQPVVNEDESCIKEQSDEIFYLSQDQPEHLEKYENSMKNFSSDHDLYPKSNENQYSIHPNVHSEQNGDYHTTAYPSQASLEKFQKYPSDNIELLLTNTLFKNLDNTKPTSCPMHYGSDCHVEVVLIHLPS